MHPFLALDPSRLATPCSLVHHIGHSRRLTYFTSSLIPLRLTPTSISLPAPSLRHRPPITDLRIPRRRRQVTSAPAVMFPENMVLADLCATAISGGVAVFFLLLWEQTAKLGVFDQKLNRKLVHISIGLVFMLCWPIFRELLKGPLYYATTITLACVVYWRTSPVAIAIICNLCAGDGLADVVGRRFGTQKLLYNRNKSIAGSVAMASAGFLSSVGYMYYFSKFSYVENSWGMVLGFLVVSLASALVESLPISTELDDNLTVPLASVLVGSLIF